MFRGVTPTYTFIAPDGLDMRQARQVWVTFATPDEREILTKTGDDVTITEHTVQVYLTQNETLRFPTRDVKVQLNWIYQDGLKVKRASSNKFIIKTENNLKNEVLYAD